MPVYFFYSFDMLTHLPTTCKHWCDRYPELAGVNLSVIEIKQSLTLNTFRHPLSLIITLPIFELIFAYFTTFTCVCR